MSEFHLPTMSDIKKLPPAWWGAIAGAGAAGATIFSSHRVVGGLGAAAAVFLLALRVHAGPCCDGCANGAGCGGTSPGPTGGDLPRNTPRDSVMTAPGPSSGGLDESVPVRTGGAYYEDPARSLVMAQAGTRCSTSAPPSMSPGMEGGYR